MCSTTRSVLCFLLSPSLRLASQIVVSFHFPPCRRPDFVCLVCSSLPSLIFNRFIFVLALGLNFLVPLGFVSLSFVMISRSVDLDVLAPVLAELRSGGTGSIGGSTYPALPHLRQPHPPSPHQHHPEQVCTFESATGGLDGSFKTHSRLVSTTAVF